MKYIVKIEIGVDEEAMWREDSKILESLSEEDRVVRISNMSSMSGTMIKSILLRSSEGQALYMGNFEIGVTVTKEKS